MLNMTAVEFMSLKLAKRYEMTERMSADEHDELSEILIKEARSIPNKMDKMRIKMIDASTSALGNAIALRQSGKSCLADF